MGEYMNQKLSVIVPIFNCEEYLRECVDSILRQTYKNMELILVDDGSVDASGDICDAYGKKDARVKVIHKKNEGLLKARLTGVMVAGGVYVTFVDGDDWIAPDAYEHMMAYIDQHDVVISGIYRYYEENIINTEYPMWREGIYDKESIEKQMIPYMLWSNKRNTWELDPSVWSKIFKKELLFAYLKEASKLDIYFGEDTAVVFPFMLKAGSVVVTHYCYYYHRQRRKGTVASYFQEEAFFEKLFSLYRYLKEEFSKSIYWNILQPQLEHFYMNAVQLKQQCFSDYREEKEDIFPFWSICKGAKVILYGAGVTGKRYFEQNQEYGFCDIVLWVDQNYKKMQKENKAVVSPECMVTASYEYLIIAIQSAGLAQQIREKLLEWNVPAEKIVWSGTLVQKIKMEKEDRASD